MKRFIILFHLLCGCAPWPYLLLQPIAYAEESLGVSIDCTDVSVDYSDDSTLTREERLLLMDKAFFESLNKFELCQSAKKKAAAAGGSGFAGSGGGGGGTEGAAGEPGGEKGNGSVGESAVNSVASSSMSGTEVPKELTPAEGIEAMEQGAQDTDEAGSKSGGNRTLQNGKLPEDIPSAKNDDALAAQIRYAAENEPDPAKSKQLWNEYRKYKGLAPK